MAVAEVLPVAAKRMIEEAARKRRIVGEHVDNVFQYAVEIAAVDALLLPLVIAAKAGGFLNRPHSATARGPWRRGVGARRRGALPSLPRSFPYSGQAARTEGRAPVRCAPS